GAPRFPRSPWAAMKIAPPPAARALRLSSLGFELLDEMPRFRDLISPQARQLSPKSAAFESVDDPRHSKIGAQLLRNHEIGPLFSKRHKIESMGHRGRAIGDPDVDQAHRHRLRHGEVSRCNPLVAIHPRGWDALLRQEAIQQLPGARTRFAV